MRFPRVQLSDRCNFNLFRTLTIYWVTWWFGEWVEYTLERIHPQFTLTPVQLEAI